MIRLLLIPLAILLMGNSECEQTDRREGCWWELDAVITGISYGVGEQRFVDDLRLELSSHYNTNCRTENTEPLGASGWQTDIRCKNVDENKGLLYEEEKTW